MEEPGEKDKMEHLDARMTQFDSRFTKMEEALQKLLQAQANPGTSNSQSKKKKPREHDSDSDQNQTPRKKARMMAKEEEKDGSQEDGLDSDENHESSDGEIRDDEDALSLEEDSDDELLKELGEDLDDREKTSEKVAESMADIVNKRFSQGLSENKLKERLEKYPRPENCQNLQVPRVNREIWKDLPATAKQADVKLAGVQRAIVKATAALAQSTQEVLKAHKNKKLTDKRVKAKVMDNNADALALLGHACHDLSVRRRFAIRPHLPKHLRGLCGDNIPVTSNLFGDNLATAIKEIKELDKISQAPGPSRRFNFKDKRSKSWQWRNKDRRPFLGKTQWQHFGGSPNFKKKAAKQQPYQRK